MKPTLLAITIALALGALAGCDRNPSTDQRPAGSGATTPQSNMPGTPANAGTPTQAERKEGSNPVQGQVDPKQPPQRKDFQQK